MRDFGVNQGIVEELYLRYRENPASVDESWRKFFESNGDMEVEAPAAPAEANGNGNGGASAHPVASYAPSTELSVPFVERRSRPERRSIPPIPPSLIPPRTTIPPTQEVVAATELQGRVSSMINQYRVRGHLFAKLDPLELTPPPPDELSLDNFGLADVDPETMFATGDFAGPPQLPLEELVRRLRETYTRTIGVEYSHVEDPSQRAWLRERMEKTCNHLDMSREEQVQILERLTDAETFEHFLENTFKGAKRFSLEGHESLIPMLDLVIERGAIHGVEEIVIGMAHRGRLNVLVNVLGKSEREIFAHFDDKHPELYLGRGDVKYHLGYSTDYQTRTGKPVHLTLSFNPSHLEFVNPVIEGRVRAKQDRRGDRNGQRVMPLLIHGDAAIAGQGIVQETLNLAGLRAYRTGGTLHIVINNQIGFTTSWEDARATRYCTDITRMLRCPVFHVNGEDPEAVAQVVHLAVEFRQRFQQDVVIDLYGYRKHGHNEADEPRFTQPVMYQAIERKKTLRALYVDKLVELGQITPEQAEEIARTRREALERELHETRQAGLVPPPYWLAGFWKNFKGGPDADVPDVETHVPLERLEALAEKLGTVPETFEAHRTVVRTVLEKRRVKGPDALVDWGTAEALAFATLLTEGTPIRFTGQDVRRGTFSHRHAVLFDTKNGEPFCPLQNLSASQGRFEIYDSALSEAGVLGFEYGYSLDTPEALVIWEAQFGDFCNGAQVIVDQFIVSGEDKWFRLSGLVLLLPHGFEGQGPEHSSARLERFLTVASEDNIQVVNLTTAANYFHALRRQVLRPWRKPLVVMSPKSLLRAHTPSPLRDLAEGRFQRIIPDASGRDPQDVRRVILCSGKVYYDLAAAREERKRHDVAIIRLEQLYPIRPEELREALAPYAKAETVWVQEEPFNMGPWYSIHSRWPKLVEGRSLRCVSRAESASPATGSHAAHVYEQRKLIEEAFEGL